MAEFYPSDAELNALSGTSDAEQEVLYIPTGQSPYYTSFYKMIHRLLNVARRAGDLRVYKDGPLTFGVRNGRFLHGDTPVDFTACSGQALTDNAVNYVYLTAPGELVVNVTGFPAPSETPHIPLATIATGAASEGGVGGQYGLADISDFRGRAFLSVAGEPAQTNVPDSSITNAKIAADAAIARTKMAEQELAAFPIPLTGFRHEHGGPLEEGDLGVDFPGFTTGKSLLSTGFVIGDAKTASGAVEFALPPEYIAASTVQLAVRGRYYKDVDAGPGECNVQPYAFKIDADGVHTSLGTFQHADLTNSTATYTFTLTSTALAPGDRLWIGLAVTVTETMGDSNVQGEIYSLKILCDIQG